MNCSKWIATSEGDTQISMPKQTRVLSTARGIGFGAHTRPNPAPVDDPVYLAAGTRSQRLRRLGQHHRHGAGYPLQRGFHSVSEGPGPTRDKQIERLYVFCSDWVLTFPEKNLLIECDLPNRPRKINRQTAARHEKRKQMACARAGLCRHQYTRTQIRRRASPQQQGQLWSLAESRFRRLPSLETCRATAATGPAGRRCRGPQACRLRLLLLERLEQVKEARVRRGSRGETEARRGHDHVTQQRRFANLFSFGDHGTDKGNKGRWWEGCNRGVFFVGSGRKVKI